DRMTYNQRTGLVTASGNVSLLEPSGDVIFADRMQITEDLRDGVIESIRVLLADRSRFAANSARLSDGNKTVMSRAVYSPCDICPDDPEHPPLWQIKAFRVIHDKEDQTIEYEDAFLEVFGIPAFYTPYFTHPDPTVERRTGFLSPTYGSTTALGLTLQVPYYVTLQPHRDFTFAPIFTTKEGVVLAGEYREHTGNGQFEIEGSITRPDRRDENGDLIGGRDTRGHIEGTGRFKLDRVWDWGFDFKRATDDTYLRRYHISNEDTLTSELFVQGIDDRRFLSAETYSFQGLNADDDPDEEPLITPLVDYTYFSDTNPSYGQWRLAANALVLHRSESAPSQASRRLSLEGGWRYSSIGSVGDVYSFSASLRGDLYSVEGVIDPNNPRRDPFDGVTGRVVPQAIFEWRYPLIARQGAYRQVIEPVIEAIVSPYGGNSEKIPNEDSQDFEFNDTNLFSSNRFTGLDRIEGGPRANYGIRWSLIGPDLGSVSALFGQSYRVKEDDTFRSGSGLEEKLSDFVGRVDFRPWDFLDVSYRFRLDRDDLSPRRNEVTAQVGPEFLRLRLDYVFLDAKEARAVESAFDAREEINGHATLKLTDEWKITGSYRRDLTPDGGTINGGVGLQYENECVILTVRANRSFTRDRDIEPETNVLFRIQLKHLG
ncbi:MAG: LPS assembly protein LptD, partial [Proteobacteria bacterium]|nr:LPS assembly protein LptD [Pseudomonadota bacterium]